MIVTPLSGRGTAVRNALLSHGWEGELARLSAGGIATSAYRVAGVTRDVIEAMVPLSVRLGLELVTGEDWLIVSGARARLGAFARPWVQPEPVRDLAMALGMAMPHELEQRWKHRVGTLDISSPVIVGVINMTPDSFADGGVVLGLDDALRRADDLLRDGATIIDVGGESTRPEATPVAARQERGRVVPLIAGLVQRIPGVLISIDTVHAATARVALDAGATIVNDVTAGRHDRELLDVVAAAGAGLVLSHSRGALGRLASYDHADYGGDVTSGVINELGLAMSAASAAGVAVDSIVVDPGFGFSKTAEQSLTLLQQLDAVVAMSRPVMVGVSRKRFLGEATGQRVDDRDRATAAACALAYDRGARVFRVHAPAMVRDALALAAAVAGAAA